MKMRTRVNRCAVRQEVQVFTGVFPHSNGMVTNSVALGDNV